jgi:hypothetical protein
VSAPTAVDRLLIRAASTGDIAVSDRACQGFVIGDADADYDTAGRVMRLARGGFLVYVDADGALVEPTTAGMEALR